MNQEQVEKVLGRTLSTTESNNFDLYIDIAIERLEKLFCIQWGDNEEETRVYSGRCGYKTLYIDPFTVLDTVTIDGDEFTPRKQQWDRRTGDWYNVLVFDEIDDMEDNGEALDVSVTATFGYGATLPSDLQLLLGRTFDLITLEQKTNPRVQSKRNEDYQVTYGSIVSEWESLKVANKSTIQKYSQCGLGQIQSGEYRKYPHRTHRHSYGYWMEGKQ